MGSLNSDNPSPRSGKESEGRAPDASRKQQRTHHRALKKPHRSSGQISRPVTYVAHNVLDHLRIVQQADLVRGVGMQLQKVLHALRRSPPA